MVQCYIIKLKLIEHVTIGIWKTVFICMMMQEMRQGETGEFRILISGRNGNNEVILKVVGVAPVGKILVSAHNKTFAAQLYGELKEFFPENAVEYFVSQHEKGTKRVVFCGMWAVEHPDVVETVVVRVQVKSGWMKRFCDFLSLDIRKIYIFSLYVSFNGNKIVIVL